ncbi:MAG: RNA methyltransferase [Acidobacteria bacterium]|nr:RNA methyltransferase [Acidobacteriota bacterium]
MTIKSDEVISSKDNARLKAARQVRDGRDRSMIFIEGLRLANEALRSDIAIREGFITAEFQASDAGGALARDLARADIAFSTCSDSAFRSIADTTNPQGIVLLADRPASADIEDIIASEEPLLFVYCFEVNDPSNLGALLRTAEAAGVSMVILSPRSTDPFTAKALRASMGAALRIPIATGIDLDELKRFTKEHRLRSFAADAAGEQNYFDVDLRDRAVIVLGGEANGLPTEVAEACDARVKIPMHEGVESLNLAVSGGILLYEAVRQRMS